MRNVNCLALFIAGLSGFVPIVAMGQAKLPVENLRAHAIYPTQDSLRLREMTLTEQGLTLSALNLSVEQIAKIDIIIDDYVEAQISANRTHPLERRVTPNQEAVVTRQTAVSNLEAALNMVLTVEQRKVRESALTSRRLAKERAASSQAASKADEAPGRVVLKR